MEGGGGRDVIRRGPVIGPTLSPGSVARDTIVSEMELWLG
jgi:hypothetical protein